MYTVYIITENGNVRYVGKTRDYTRRKREHLNIGASKSSIPTDVNISNIEFHTIKVFNNELEALKYEDSMILKYNTINKGWNKYRSGNIWADDVNAYNRERNKTPNRKEWKKAYNRQRYLRKKTRIK